MPVYKFRNCLLNTLERLVIKDNECIELTTRTFDVLLYLIENAGNVVSKDEILGHVWSGNFVEESNLPVHISKLRRLLGGKPGGRFIETVQGVGYRFVAPVKNVAKTKWHEQLDLATVSRVNDKRGELAFESIAILPFGNQSSEKGFDYVADGLTESLINRLSLVPGLRMIARDTVFRYKSDTSNPAEIGGMLGVAAVLIGSINISDERFLLSVELVRVSDGAHIWRNKFEDSFSEIVRVQEEITATVIERVRSSSVETADDMTNYLGTRDAESYKAYLKGAYFLGKRTVPAVYKAISYFSDSVKYDSQNFYPLVKTVDCYRFLYIIDAISHKTALKKLTPILTRIPNGEDASDSVHLMYAELHLQLYWDFKKAEEHVRRALQLNPNCVHSTARYAEILAMTDRGEEALSQIRRVLEIDPFSLVTYKRISRIFYGLGHYGSAIEFLNDALELEPNDYEALALMGGVLTELCDYKGALDLFRKSLEIQHTVDVLAMVGYVEGLRGRKSIAREIIREISSNSKAGSSYPLKLARIYFVLGEKDTAYLLLNEAFERREVELYGLLYDPRWKLVRHETRFLEAARRVESLAGKRP